MSGPSLADLPNPLDERVTVLNHHEPRTNGACYILCWLQQALRADDNPALDVAISLGNRMGLPVLVYHGLRMDYPHASDRLHRFILSVNRWIDDIIVLNVKFPCLPFPHHFRAGNRSFLLCLE